MGAIAVRVLLRFPASADRDRLGLIQLENERLHVCDFVRAIAERQIFASGAAAVRDTFRYLSDDRRFDQIIVR